MRFSLTDLFVLPVGVSMVCLAARVVADAVVDTLVVSCGVLFCWL